MTNQLDESSYFYGKDALAKFKEKADSVHGEGNWKAGTKDSFGSYMFHNKSGDRVDGEGDHTYTVFHKASPVPKGVKEEVESIDELSNSTLQSVAKKRLDQSKAAGGIGINNPARAKAMDLLRKSDNAKYRHTEQPSKITPPKPPVPPTPEQLAAHKKTQADKADDLQNRGYGKERYMGDSVESEEVEDQLDEAIEKRYGLPVYTHDQVLKKIKSGSHEAVTDVEKGKRIELRNNSTGKTVHVYVKEEVLDEISRDTVDSYLEKAKKDRPMNLVKTIRRFAGKERANDRVHSDEMKKMNVRLSANLKNEEAVDEAAAQKNMANAMDNIDPEKRDRARKQYTKGRSTGLTHAASLNLMYQRFGKTNESEELDMIMLFQKEHLVETGELLSLDKVKYILENHSGGSGKIAQHGGVDGKAPQNTGKVKKMMGNKIDAAAIAKIIANGAKLSQGN